MIRLKPMLCFLVCMSAVLCLCACLPINFSDGGYRYAPSPAGAPGAPQQQQPGQPDLVHQIAGGAGAVATSVAPVVPPPFDLILYGAGVLLSWFGGQKKGWNDRSEVHKAADAAWDEAQANASPSPSPFPSLAKAA